MKTSQLINITTNAKTLPQDLAQAPLDRLSALLERFRVRAHLFHTGPLCGVTHFATKPGRGFLHVLRRGEMTLSHRSKTGLLQHLVITEPTLLFYPSPLAHDFQNAPVEGSDFTCATLDFDGGESHPLVRALPSVVVVPLKQIEGLQKTLDLLFAETDQLRCGHRLIADRLFEVLLLQLLRWMLDHPVQAHFHDQNVSVGLLAGLSDPALARVLVALHEQPGQAWQLESMAKRAGMSRSGFAVKFKSVVGETPADYLAQWRLTIAKTQLRQGRSVKAISDELGYANASALSRVFNQKMGLSPRAWLESNDGTEHQ
jgi:AraC-like DNA-binding protein